MSGKSVLALEPLIVSESTERPNITENGFDFIHFRNIHSHDPELVLDILGEVKTENITIDCVEMKHGKAKKCDITLADADGTQVICVLWESYADELKIFMESRSSEDKEPVMIALQFAMLSTFRGVTKVSTMKHATRFFISPDIQEVKDFILRRGLTKDSNNNTVANISNVSREVKSEEWLKPALVKTIKEMKNSESGNYICKGTIIDFHPEESWYYESCGNDKCYKGVPKGSKIGDYCKKCKKPIGSINIRQIVGMTRLNYLAPCWKESVSLKSR
ncbi:uncharacterized protein LOC130994490 [Salvia miltiorrhiza]|uniref:uncharacterized protein LOC130994490 n=1 Tax=Salvia miltiorrhiza TaxID=226208 RepID=UPI0025ABB8C6|nr:uncharacterized protein LOC130994490 [Salvia miltiorrhiza]